MDISSISLPKWPALIVYGKPVSRKQAIEILFRTNDTWSTNDRYWLQQVREFFGDELVEQTGSDWFLAFKDGVRLNKWGCLDLYYLCNSRICSSWIGGPHGWCDWNGQIFSNNYNIGKWPTVENVFEEWKTIARAFPFLSLRAQLLDGETCEDGAKALVEFIVENGEVQVVEPTETLQTSEVDMAAFAESLSSGRRYETVDFDKFVELYNEFMEIRGEPVVG